jgi:hypothetical protein
MKEHNNFLDETFLREIMSKGKLEVPFSDLDDKIMRSIEIRNMKRKSILRDIKISWIFFFLGSTLGIIISVILPTLQETVFGITIDKCTIPVVTIICFLLIFQLDSLLNSYKRQRRIDTNREQWQ